MSMNKQSIIDKIKALKKLESGTNSQGEAEAAAHAIAAIIDRYKLAMHELENESQQESYRKEVDKSDLGEGYERLPNYKRVLLNAIAHHCGVRVISHANGNGLRTRSLIGFESDVEFTRHLYSWLLVEMVDLCPGGHGRAYSQSWRLGFAHGIDKQLKLARKEVLESVPDNKRAAIVLCKSPAVDEFIEKTFPHVKLSNFRAGFSNSYAYLDGALQGESTHLGKRLQNAAK